MYTYHIVVTRNFSKIMNNKKTLTRKLLARERVQQNRAGDGEPVIVDIEDSFTALPATSRYFSPVQTRRQRQTNLCPPQKSDENLGARPVTPQGLETFNRAWEIKPKVGKKFPKVTVPSVEVISININPPTSETLPQFVKRTTQVKKIVHTPKKEQGQEDNDDGKANWEPTNWREMLKNIRKMRADGEAPVDSMGCHKCSDENADEKTQRFHYLVALMLSSQTKDETTFAAMQRLRANGLTPATILAMDTTELENLLNPVSFYKNKAKYLQNTSRFLIDHYNSDIPKTIPGLVSLPGVGPKMAHICMATAWNKVTGIGVDVHVNRITNRLHWVPKPTKEPEQTRVALEAWLPRELWREVNYLLVGFGQTICTPLRPHCGDCLNNQICPSVVVGTGTTKKKGAAKQPDESSGIPEIKKVKFQKQKMHL